MQETSFAFSWSAFHYAKDHGNLCQLEVKWKGLFQFLPTRILWITSRDGLLTSIGKIVLKFSIPCLTNWFSCTSLHLNGNLEKESKMVGVNSSWFRKISFHFPVSGQSVWHNGKHACSLKFPLMLLQLDRNKENVFSFFIDKHINTNFTRQIIPNSIFKKYFR